MTDAAPAPRRFLPLKVAALVTLIGPGAGALCLAIFAFIGEMLLVFSEGGANFKDMLLGVPWFFFMGYMFGALPALAAGIAVGAYMHLTGRQPWLVGLVIGALAPPLCLAAIGVSGLPQSSMDWDWLRETATVMLFAGGLGFGAALITSLAIRLMMRRALAEYSAKM